MSDGPPRGSGQWRAKEKKWRSGVRYTGQIEKTLALGTILVLVYETTNL